MRIPAAGSAHLAPFLALLHASAHKRARYVLPRLFSHLREEGIRDVRSVAPQHLFAFAHSLTEERTPPLAAGTRSAYLSTVRRFFAFLSAQGVILLDPARELPVSRPRRLPWPVPSEARVRRLMNACFLKTPLALRDRAILETLYGTGIRRGECRRLDLRDVDLRAGTLFVRDGKGKKDRVLPLLGRARDALDTYLEDGREDLAKRQGERALFLSRCGGKRLSEDGLGLVVTRHQGEARLTPHLLRHAYATHLLAGGASIRHVQALLGHRGIQTTALYTRVDIAELRRVIERAHPLSRNSRVSRRHRRDRSRVMLGHARQGRPRRRVE